MQVRPFSPYREPEFIRQINQIPFDQEAELNVRRAAELMAVNLVYARDRRRERLRRHKERARAFLSGIALFLIGWACAIGWGAL